MNDARGSARDLFNKPEEYLEGLLQECGRDEVAKMMLRAKYEAVNAKDARPFGNPDNAPIPEAEPHPGFWIGNKHYNCRGELE
jgi:hypothetical protein